MPTTTVFRFPHRTDLFDKPGNVLHPQKAMTTATTRAAALSGLIIFVVILILP